MRNKWREEKGLHKNEIQQEKEKTLINKNMFVEQTNRMDRNVWWKGCGVERYKKL